MDSNAIADKVSSSQILDKPLAELTEEDIAQLTREDCRNFLKQKGMRRPSWNKSQAIQQVISLKALIEGRPRGDDCPAGPGILRKPPSEVPSDSVAATASLSGNSSQIGAPSSSEARGGREPQSPRQKEPSAYRRIDSALRIFPSGDHPARIPVFGRENQLPDSQRTATRALSGQMTIFYEGKINVFESVTQEQAQIIMDVAWSSGRSVAETASPKLARPPLPWTRSTGNESRGIKVGLDDGRVSRDTEPEGLTIRKASVQRYLEKRKDRFKGKRVDVGSAPSGLEMLYLSQKFRCQNSNEPVSGTEKGFIIPQPPGTPARRNSIENRNQKIRLSIDLNDDGGGIDEPT